jgi:hypothetical protein
MRGSEITAIFSIFILTLGIWLIFPNFIRLFSKKNEEKILKKILNILLTFPIYFIILLTVTLIPVYFMISYKTTGTSNLEYYFDESRSNYSVGIGYSNDLRIKVPQEFNESTVYAVTDYGFANKSSFISVSLPKTITYIYRNAFFNCENLNSIELSEGLLVIFEEAFKNCINLTDIKIPSTVSQIGYGAFEGCENLKSISLPEGITEISQNLFKGCKNLTSIKIPNSVVKINANAFKDCENLAYIEIPSTIESIAARAFENTNFTIDTIPEIVKQFGETALVGVTGYEGNQTKDENEDGIFRFSPIPPTARTYEIFKNNEISQPEVFIPSIFNRLPVTKIGNYGFSDQSKIISLSIPQSIIEIGYGAFEGCENLINVEFSEGLKQLSTNAFKDCKSIITLNLPQTLADISSGAFENCLNLKNISIPTNTFVEKNVFLNCPNISTINSKKVKMIGERTDSGGYIFYITYNKGNIIYYEIADKENEFTINWNDFSHLEYNETTYDSGKENTELLIKKMDYAVRQQFLEKLYFDDNKDWYIPSRWELEIAYNNISTKKLGNFSRGWYWTSSSCFKNDSYSAYFVVNMIKYTENDTDLGGILNIRPVRMIIENAPYVSK